MNNPILSPDTKAKMYTLYNKNRFGNRLRSFTLDSYLAAVEANNVGLVALRVKVAGDPWYLELNAAQVKRYYDPDKHIISEHAPDHNLTIQGELQRSTNGWYLYYSTEPGYTMREGLPRFGQHARGLYALSLLKVHMDPSAYDDMMELFDTWDEAIVEFSCYGQAVGWANQNTLVWELRCNY